MNQLVFVSATPGAFELRRSEVVAEQLIRPTGIVDPEVELRATKNQIDDLLSEIRRREEVGERVLVTTLTKKMSEDLTDYLLEAGVKARYLHSEIDTLERIQIIRELRLGDYDVLVGVNLLREGLDLPEVSLVAVLDADKEGFLRGKTALVQTIGRAARNVNGQGAALRGQADGGDPGRARGDGPAPRGAAGVQRRARDHAGDDRQGRLRHRRAARARVADGADAAPARQDGGRGDVTRRDREARRSRSRRRCSSPPRSFASSTPAKLRDEIKDLRRELTGARQAPLPERGLSRRGTVPQLHHSRYGLGMCRNIRTLHNFEPPATDEEVDAAALQYVRKIAGMKKPSRANEEAFARAVETVASASRRLLADLVTTAPPRDREREAARARARAAARFGGLPDP